MILLKKFKVKEIQEKWNPILKPMGMQLNDKYYQLYYRYHPIMDPIPIVIKKKSTVMTY